ncbi:hypothetical protein ACFP2T_18400 [Plantactinospora solaniradicis]|uniref:Endoglucanase B carbohydrate binding domain-containing protein n=1 Tax=Plantactinospora solaniradicis TaxID=1723736 RepID=A0ABW1K8P5_9ACTN
MSIPDPGRPVWLTLGLCDTLDSSCRGLAGSVGQLSATRRTARPRPIDGRLHQHRNGEASLTFHFWSGTQITYRLTKAGSSVTGGTT